MSLFDFARRRSLPLAGIAGILAILIGASGCDSQIPIQHSRFLAFGTYMDLELIGVNQQQAAEASAVLETDFQVMHETWHAWDPGPVARVNDYVNEGKRIAAPPSVLPLIQRSTELADLSEHLFNPAIGQLIRLWGFQQNDLFSHPPPAEETIAYWVERNPRMTDLKIDGYHLESSNAAVRLDFGGIGKGYGIDFAIERLREMDIHNAIVNAGGDLRAIGSRSGHPWRVAVRDPSGGGVFGVIPIHDNEAVFTSGDYERYFTWQGERYHHIIDPRTGYPAKGTASVTVVHPDATVADAAATALFVAGPDDWHRVARKMGIKYVMLIASDGTVHMNPGMQARVTLQASVPDIIISDPL